MPCAAKCCFRVLLRLVAFRRRGFVRVLLRCFGRVLQFLLLAGCDSFYIFMFNVVFLLLVSFPCSLPRPLSSHSLSRVPLRLQPKLEQCATSSVL